MKPKVVIYSIVPSPYQRDLFYAISQLESLVVEVYYLEAGAPDSPWGTTTLRAYEHILPGWCVGKGRIRSHLNWRLPKHTSADLVILNLSVTDMTTHLLIKYHLRNTKWLFWAEISQKQNCGWKERVSRWLYKVIDASTGIIAIGSAAQQSYQEVYPDKTVYNLPYHIKCPSPQPETKQGHCVSFLFCGQMIHRKAIDVLLKAFESVIQNNITAELILVGREAELSQYLATVSKPAQEKIHYLGFKQPDELPGVFAQADVFVLPSRRDGWGVVVNQALAAGLPVITSDAVGAAKDLVIDNKNGYCVPAGQSEPLAEAMIKLAGSSERRQQFGQESLRMAQGITPEAGAKQFKEIVFDVCSQTA